MIASLKSTHHSPHSQTEISRYMSKFLKPLPVLTRFPPIVPSSWKQELGITRPVLNVIFLAAKSEFKLSSYSCDLSHRGFSHPSFIERLQG